MEAKTRLKNRFSLHYSRYSVSTIKNRLCNGKIMWKFKVLYGNTDANKEPLF